MPRSANPLSDPDELTVTVSPDATTTALVYPADRDAIGAALMLAHGAGAGQRSPWMVQFARALSTRGLDIVTFNFLYGTPAARAGPAAAPRGVLSSGH